MYLGRKCIVPGKNVQLGSNVYSEGVVYTEDNCVIGSHYIIGCLSKFELQKTDFSITSPKATEFAIKSPCEGYVCSVGNFIDSRKI